MRQEVHRVCSIEGCDRPWYCRAHCRLHYNRWRLMSTEERDVELAKLKSKPVFPKWEYENAAGEAELAARCGEQKDLTEAE